MVFLSLYIDYDLANSADPAEMSHYTAFHLGLHCLLKYASRSHITSIVYRKGLLYLLVIS